MYFLYFFWFTMCTSIIFFFPIIRIYDSIYFICFFCFFFFCCLQRAHQSFFFSSILYCKNLCTFFRIKINVLIVLESIIICFIWYFYHKRTWHTDKPNCFGQKNTKRIRICVLFLYLSPLFWQCHCHKPITTIFPPISAMALPQTNCNNFFSLLFRQCHCHKSITQFFFFEK